MKPLFITFEGIEGCGKTTQASLLAEWLKQQGEPVLLTKEPGGSSIGNIIRPLCLQKRQPRLADMAELFLMLAERAQHVEEVIRPALKNHTPVICDRYIDSTIAYQYGARHICDKRMISLLNSMATGYLTPDITFLLDLEVNTGLSRVLQRKEHLTTFEHESFVFHQAVRGTYLEMAKEEYRRFFVIQVSEMSIEQIHEQILVALITPFSLYSNKRQTKTISRF